MPSEQKQAPSRAAAEQLAELIRESGCTVALSGAGKQVVDAAAAHGRKVALIGRSMRKNVNIGRSLGHIYVPDGMLVRRARSTTGPTSGS